jgi:hypothetical protein
VSVEDVFRKSAKAMGSHLSRLPDGELGSRAIWIAWQRAVFDEMEGFEDVPPVPGAYVQRPLLRAKQGLTANDVVPGPLGYADAATESYAIFKRLRNAGEIPAHMRFQVGLPTPLEPVIGMFTSDTHALMAPIYEKRLLGELDQILAAIPHDRLAIQWETVYLLGVIEGFWTTSFDPGEIPGRLGALADLIPEPAHVGYHLCYGDSGHRHFKQPHDARVMVDVANGIAGAAKRPIQWMHMPVPRDRTDDAFFQPLGDLDLQPSTRLFLGVVHHTDGEAGARKRIEAASRYVSDFGVATECGLGRRAIETISDVMAIHTAVAGPL